MGFALFPLLSGCYPLQASLGHMDLMAKRQPLEDIVSDSTTTEDLRLHLQRVAAIREFASRELDLPDNGSFRSYAKLDGDFPVWNVWVTPEFELQPRESCFPVVGCVPYRGYYSKELAQDYADEFSKAGDDVMVGGVTAYSTLGFFDDPITSAMLRLPEERLAGLIFHELAHQVVYVRDNTTFNESFARAVEIEGTLHWLNTQRDSQGLARYRASLERADRFFAEIKSVRMQLEAVYSTPVSPSMKRLNKAKIFEAMRDAQQRRKAADPAWRAYDAWFSGDLNNATLAAVSTYYDDVAMFREMLRQSGGNFSAFYAAVQAKAAQLAGSPRIPA